MDKEQKRQHRLEQKNKWMPHYELKYGVQPTEFKPATASDELPVVIKAKCRFCECFGREHAVEASQLSVADLKDLTSSAAAVAAMHGVGVNMQATMGVGAMGSMTANGAIVVPTAGGTPMILKKRKKRQTLKIFGPNFRTDNLESHLSREHPTKWKEYDKLREKDKANFFPETNFMLRDPSMSVQLAAATSGGIPGANVTSPGSLSSGLSSPAAAAEAAAAVATAAMKTTQHHVATTQAEFAAAVAGVAPVPQHGHGHHGNGTSATGNAAAAAAAIVASVAGTDSLGGLASTNNSTLVMPFKFVLSCELMEVVVQLLGNRSSGSKVPNDTAGSTSSSSPWWQQFVRVEDTIRPSSAANNSSDPTSATSSTLLLSSAADIKLMNNMYTVSIANEPLFLYVTEMLKAGINFDSTVWMVNATKRILPHSMRVFGGNAEYTGHDMVSVVQRLTCANLSCISQLMNSAWTFALHLQFVTLYSSGFVNVSIQIAVNDAIHHLHLVSIPLDAQKHTVSSLCVLLIKLLTCLDSRGLEKVIGVILDGDPYHCARFKAIGVMFRQELEKKTKESTFYVLTSGVYQLNELMNELLQNFEAEFGFLTSLMEIKNFCLNRPALMEQMGTSCNAANASGTNVSAAAAASLGGSSYTAPFGILSGAFNASASTAAAGVTGTSSMGGTTSSSSASSSILNGGTVHWVQVFETCEWLALHRELILKCFEEYEKAQANHPLDLGLQTSNSSIPSNRWWILNFVLKDFMKDVYSAFSKCELGASSVADVQRHLRELVFHLRIKYNLRMASPTEAAAADANAAVSSSSSNGGNENDDGNSSEPTSLDVKMEEDQLTGAGEASLSGAASSLSAAVTNPEDDDEQHGFTYQDFVNAVIPLDLFMYETFQLENIKEIDEKERVAIYQLLKTNVFGFVAKLVEKLDASLPPSTPFEFVVMNNLSFMEFLNQHQARLRAKYTGKILAMITEDRNRMLGEFAQKGVFYEQTNGIAKRNVPFEASWQQASVEYSSLFQLALGFGSLLAVRKRLWMFLPTQQLQLQGMEEQCLQLSNLRLEAFFQSHQFDLLVNLRRFVDAYV